MGGVAAAVTADATATSTIAGQERIRFDPNSRPKRRLEPDALARAQRRNAYVRDAAGGQRGGQRAYPVAHAELAAQRGKDAERPARGLQDGLGDACCRHAER